MIFVFLSGVYWRAFGFRNLSFIGVVGGVVSAGVVMERKME